MYSGAITPIVPTPGFALNKSKYIKQCSPAINCAKHLRKRVKESGAWYWSADDGAAQITAHLRKKKRSGARYLQRGRLDPLLVDPLADDDIVVRGRGPTLKHGWRRSRTSPGILEAGS